MLVGRRVDSKTFLRQMLKIPILRQTPKWGSRDPSRHLSPEPRGVPGLGLSSKLAWRQLGRVSPISFCLFSGYAPLEKREQTPSRNARTKRRGHSPEKTRRREDSLSRILLGGFANGHVQELLMNPQMGWFSCRFPLKPSPKGHRAATKTQTQFKFSMFADSRLDKEWIK